jgi:hypothetical protein
VGNRPYSTKKTLAPGESAPHRLPVLRGSGGSSLPGGIGGIMRIVFFSHPQTVWAMVGKYAMPRVACVSRDRQIQQGTRELLKAVSSIRMNPAVKICRGS